MYKYKIDINILHLKVIAHRVIYISMDHNLRMKRVIIDIVCRWGCPVNTFPDVSFTMEVYGENAFWAAWGFFTVAPQVATGKNWKQV